MAFIKTEIHGRVGTIAFDHYAKRNALSTRLIDKCLDVLARFRRERDTRRHPAQRRLVDQSRLVEFCVHVEGDTQPSSVRPNSVGILPLARRAGLADRTRKAEQRKCREAIGCSSN